MRKEPLTLILDKKGQGSCLSSFYALLTLVVILLALPWAPATAQECIQPREVVVLPIFFVPKGESPPTAKEFQLVMRHLEWSRTRYAELMKNLDTFTLAQGQPLVYFSEQTLDYYRTFPEGAAPQYAQELLGHFKFNRFNCPYILTVIIMNPKGDFPTMGGRPLNGGINTGGGIIIFSSYTMNRYPAFQSALQHELGHTFGLTHVDRYKYDMKTNASIMSYNPAHQTKGFEPSKTPGVLIPEDLRALSLNKRVFPKFWFDSAKDIPPGYSIAKHIAVLPPQNIPGNPGIKVKTSSGEAFGSKAGNVVHHEIKLSKPGKEGGYDRDSMWHSAKTKTGWVSLELTFPFPVTLTSTVLHSQHSGQYHAAQAVWIGAKTNGKNSRQVVQTQLRSVDEKVAFPQTRAQVWKLDFQAGQSGMVVIRGLQFYAGNEEIFPPLLVHIR